MKAYDLYKIDSPKISPGNDFKTPPLPKVEIEMEPMNKNSGQNFISSTTKNGGKLFPWKTVCVIVLVFVVTYLIHKTYRKKITKKELESHKHHKV